MSITINGATNTLTAASGLTVAGNTTVTGTLSATTSVQGGPNGGGGLILQTYTGGTFGAIYSTTVTPGATNYSLISTGANTYLNGTASSNLTVGSTLIAAATATGLAVTGTLSTEKAADNELLVKSTGAGGAGNTRLRLYSTTASTPYDWYVQGDANGTLRFYDAQGGAERANISSTALTLASGVNLVMAPSYIEGAEMTAPAAPAANGFRIFAEDNGAGKTRLMVQFATGAAQQLAIEP